MGNLNKASTQKEFEMELCFPSSVVFLLLYFKLYIDVLPGEQYVVL